jgi:hypothetical protein
MGWGDMFAGRRVVTGTYFQMTNEDAARPAYYLFERGKGGSVTGPLKTIGWNGSYILVQEDSKPDASRWAIFAVDAQLSPVPADPERREQLRRELIRSVVLRSPGEVLTDAR